MRDVSRADCDLRVLSSAVRGASWVWRAARERWVAVRSARRRAKAPEGKRFEVSSTVAPGGVLPRKGMERPGLVVRCAGAGEGGCSVVRGAEMEAASRDAVRSANLVSGLNVSNHVPVWEL